MRNLVLVAMVLLGATVAEGRPTSLHLHLPPPPPKVPTPLSSTLPLLLPALSLSRAFPPGKGKTFEKLTAVTLSIVYRMEMGRIEMCIDELI